MRKFKIGDKIKVTKPYYSRLIGQKLIAVNHLNGKEAIVRCHPDDEFDLEFGAKLAVDRLFKAYSYSPIIQTSFKKALSL